MTRPSYESPTWSNPQLSLCGFALRGVSPPRAVVCQTQVHGAASHRVQWGPGAKWPENPPLGDAVWTTAPGLPVAVRVADCVPILLWSSDPQAVGAVHAGWRGTAADIVGRSLAFAHREMGVEPARVHAAIGPCISRDRFEVGPEVVDGLKQAGLTDEDLRVVQGPRGKPHVDLRSANRALLRRAGVPDVQIEDVGGCTFSQPDLYDSYRRDGERSGRMRATIALASQR